MSRPKEKPAEFFVDRSLGKSIVKGLRAAGLSARSMAEVRRETWPASRRRGLVARRWRERLDRSHQGRRNPPPAERDALIEAAVRVFCLTNRNLRGAEQAERFIANRHRILRQARKPGPYIYGVYAEGLKRLWP